ncbi:MAG: 16S rRNA (guanine(966)-N(2))-methyltransferase RsmD [Pseudanabaena frigida]|uniref:16S rRNA (Guanine(966)-N(2))-methyltransferase RsmD n=1 Tax=Pseudanabaena frigida TaxID=945775 RepID=A0A2W4WFG3_9CYAN|nr:MAG: 16S rRNA (guanine(966)-N(2))-methyltransferase RsmD [Pseudanabaena frigida]
MSIRINGARPIKTSNDLSIRPTASKVRAAVFNILQTRIKGANWLDVCAGSGAMGAEALVRGAANIVGLELSAIACQIASENWQKFAKSDQTFQVIKGDAVKTLRKLQPQYFDLVYFDPPYQSDLYQPVLTSLSPLLKDNALVIAECDRLRPLPDVVGDLICCDRRQYGQTALVFYEKE